MRQITSQPILQILVNIKSYCRNNSMLINLTMQINQTNSLKDKVINMMQEEIGHLSGFESIKEIALLVKNFPSKETQSSNGFTGEFWQNLYFFFFRLEFQQILEQYLFLIITYLIHLIPLNLIFSLQHSEKSALIISSELISLTEMEFNQLRDSLTFFFHF